MSVEPTLTNHPPSQREPEKIRVKEPQPQAQPQQQQQQHQPQPLSNKDKTKEQYTDEPIEPRQPKPTLCKQPLPGFHQAFGSTEIGRFSRSEFFANMVGENNSGVSRNRNSSIDTTDQSTSSSSSRLGHHSDAIGTTSNNPDEIIANNRSNNGGSAVDTAENLNGLTSLTPHYDNVRNTMPRWHSPYVSAIGGEI